MKTMQAEYKTDIARLAEDMAKLATEAGKRETRLLLSVAAMIGLGIANPGLHPLKSPGTPFSCPYSDGRV